MIWKKQKALAALGIRQERFNLQSPEILKLNLRIDAFLHGYSYGSTFAVNPQSEHLGTAGIHEMSHIVLGHTYGDAAERPVVTLREVEACACAILSLKLMGGTADGIQAQEDHLAQNLEAYKQTHGSLPAGFHDKVAAAFRLLRAGGVEG